MQISKSPGVLSRTLVSEFLWLEKQGLRLPRSIVLYGFATRVMTRLSLAMDHELAPIRSIKILIGSESRPPFNRSGKYCIDVGYFFGKEPCPLEPRDTDDYQDKREVR